MSGKNAVGAWTACLILGATLMAGGGTARGAVVHPWMNTALSAQARAALLVAAMTLPQKIEQLHGDRGVVPGLPQCGSSFRHVPGIAALDIPTFRISNGPVGLGAGDCIPRDRATALPAALALAASFDTALARQFGNVIGGEARTLGVDELEGPGMNLARVGQGGRNFEYLGEDPYLAGAMAASEIGGIQRNGVIAMAKHYVLNEQEAFRDGGSVVVNDRTLHEVYLLPFEMAVKLGRVGSVMCSYNRIGGSYSCQDSYTLNTVLRGQWRFPGYVQSDFYANHSTAPALTAGMDLEMPGGIWYDQAHIDAALASRTLTTATIDRALTRRYVQMFRFGIFDLPVTKGTIDAAADGAQARQIAERTAVLLKNTRHLLPLAAGVASIALIGQQTYAGAATAGGGGSSTVSPLYTVTPEQGIRNILRAVGSSAAVRTVIVRNDNSNLADATAAARRADVVIVMAGVVTTEGQDRAGLSLPDGQNAVISAVAKANPRTVLVLKDGDPVLMPWIDRVPAVLEAWNPGEEDGDAVARLLFGLNNPSGKLPITIPRSAEQTPTSTPRRYPGVTVNGRRTISYFEGLQMGHRWYQTRGVAPQFAFGHGLSYTSFGYSKLVLTPTVSAGAEPIEASFTVANTGKVFGADVSQIYLDLPASTGEPPGRLVGFTKTMLRPGEKKRISITIDPAAPNHPLSTWNTKAQRWTTADGAYTVHVGDSSDYTPLTQAVTVRTP